MRVLVGGIILRYGMFHGRDIPSTLAMVDLIRKRWQPTVLSNVRARTELGWRSQSSTAHEGFTRFLRKAA